MKRRLSWLYVPILLLGGILASQGAWAYESDLTASRGNQLDRISPLFMRYSVGTRLYELETGRTSTWTGASSLTVGEATTGVTTAGGSTKIYGYAYHQTNALTGDVIGVKGNARVAVDSTSGKAIGGYFLAGNGVDSGYSVGILRGAYIGVVKKTGTAKTITAARGIETVMDWDAITTTTTTLTGARFEIQTGNTAAAPTNSAGIHITNQAVIGSGASIASAILVTQFGVGSSAGFTYGLDFGDTSFPDDGITFTNNIFGTADIRLCNGELIDNTTNGHIAMGGVVDFAGTGTKVATAGLLHGAGATNQAGAYSLGTGSVKGMSYYLSSTSTSASEALEGFYITTYHGVNATSAAPKGEAGRFRAYLVGDADGVCGAHNTVEMGAGASTTGLTLGSYNNIVFANEVVTSGGTYAGLQGELFLGGTSTDVSGTTTSILRLSIGGSTPSAAAQFTVPVISLVLPTNLVGDNLVVDDAASANAVGGKLRITINGAEYWIMLADSHD